MSKYWVTKGNRRHEYNVTACHAADVDPERVRAGPYDDVLCAQVKANHLEVESRQRADNVSAGLCVLGATLLLLFALSGCTSSYVDVGVGYKGGDSAFEGSNPTGYIGIGREMRWNTRCEYQHISTVSGPRNENWIDQFVCIKRFGGQSNFSIAK